MYFPLPSEHIKAAAPSAGTSFGIELPDDLQTKVAEGKVKLMIPKDGLPICVGRDINEKIEKLNAAKRRQLIHRVRTWRPGKRK